MTAYIARRVFLFVPMLLLLSIFTFVLNSVVPGDPTGAILGENASAEAKRQVERDLGLDRPIVVGEYPAGGSAYYELAQTLDTAYSLGYAGAFGWSYWSGDGISHWSAVAPTFSAWVADHWSDVNLGGIAHAPAPGPIQAQQYPYSLQNLALQLDADGVVAMLLPGLTTA